MKIKLNKCTWHVSKTELHVDPVEYTHMIKIIRWDLLDLISILQEGLGRGDLPFCGEDINPFLSYLLKIINDSFGKIHGLVYVTTH
jgi:hypothetical protein